MKETHLQRDRSEILWDVLKDGHVVSFNEKRSDLILVQFLVVINNEPEIKWAKKIQIAKPGL